MNARPRRAAPRPSRRATQIASWITIPAAVIASGILISTASYSAFSATTANPGNSWAVGSVALSDDDAGTALFSATGLKPGSTASKCITVTSTGTLPALVKLYGANGATTNGLSAYIDLTVTQGTGGSFGSCTGFTPISGGGVVYTGTVAGLGTNYATGAGNWTTTGGTAPQARTFKIDYTIDAATPNTAQNGTATVVFTWEAQNT